MPWDEAPWGLLTFDEAIEWLRSYNRHLADVARARAATESMSDQDIAVWLRGHLGPNQYRCSFCGRSQEQVKRLLVGPAAYICDECIEVFHEVVEEQQSRAL